MVKSAPPIGGAFLLRESEPATAGALLSQFGLGANNTAFISLNTLDKSNPVAFGLNRISLFPASFR
jgi:hypothetical protein